MNAGSADTAKIRLVLIETFSSSLAMVSDEVIDDLIEGKAPEVHHTQGGAKLHIDWPTVFSTVQAWAPVVGTMWEIAKGLRELYVANKREPRADDVLSKYETINGPIPPDNRATMAQIATRLISRD